MIWIWNGPLRSADCPDWDKYLKTVANVFGFAGILGFSPFPAPASRCLVLMIALSGPKPALSDNFGRTPPSRSHQVDAIGRLGQIHRHCFEGQLRFDFLMRGVAGTSRGGGP